jgi:hypothetical protein
VTIFTTITIVFWVFFTLYNILTGDPDLKIDPALLEPISPTLDTQTLSEVENRAFFGENDVTSPFIISPETTPVITQASEEEEEIAIPTDTPSIATDEAVLE